MTQTRLDLSGAPWPFGDLPRGHFRTILADPPWRFINYSRKGEGKNPNQHYPCMPLADIQAMPVADLCTDDAALVMWCTSPMLDVQIETLKRWGFTYKAAGSWAKQSTTGRRWAFGPGYIYRVASEFYVLGSRGNPKYLNRSVRNLIVAPNREHSRKPDQMRRDVEALLAPPYLELFATETAPNWSSWGNHTDKFSPPDASKREQHA